MCGYAYLGVCVVIVVVVVLMCDLLIICCLVCVGVCGVCIVNSFRRLFSFEDLNSWFVLCRTLTVLANIYTSTVYFQVLVFGAIDDGRIVHI